MTDKTSTEILEEGLRRLERRGWRQNGYGNADTGYCALGALGLTWNNEIADLSQAQAISRLQAAIGDDSIPTWNDHPGTSKEDVILAFKKAIHDE